MDDKLKALSLLGLGYVLLNQTDKKRHVRSAEAPQYKVYSSGVYDITFEYPADWTENKNYTERFEGEDGFFEVAEMNSFGRDIDEVVLQEIESPIHPYGTDPTVEAFTLDGEPARLILPSADQDKIFGREVALIVKNKKPVMEGDETYNYTVIWSDIKNISHIVESFKFNE